MVSVEELRRKPEGKGLGEDPVWLQPHKIVQMVPVTSILSPWAESRVYTSPLKETILRV